MIRQKQFYRNAADLADLLGRGLNVKTRLRRRRARALNTPSVNLHQAQTTRAVHTKFRVIAECRQIDVGLANEFEQVTLSFNRYCLSIDRQCWLCNYVHADIP